MSGASERANGGANGLVLYASIPYHLKPLWSVCNGEKDVLWDEVYERGCRSWIQCQCLMHNFCGLEFESMRRLLRRQTSPEIEKRCSGCGEFCMKREQYHATNLKK